MTSVPEGYTLMNNQAETQGTLCRLCEYKKKCDGIAHRPPCTKLGDYFVKDFDNVCKSIVERNLSDKKEDYSENPCKDIVDRGLSPLRDKKWDTGKPNVYQMKQDFSKALLAVARVTSYGIEKYNKPGSWRSVEDCHKRYESALGRHDLQGYAEDYDEESKILHAALRAWNALATLEIMLEELPVEEVATT